MTRIYADGKRLGAGPFQNSARLRAPLRPGVKSNRFKRKGGEDAKRRGEQLKGKNTLKLGTRFH